jgi:ribonuclease HII
MAYTRKMICGVDEAGRGPVIGPLVVAGVMLEDDGPLIEMKVKDSKKCTPNQRERLAEQIKRIARTEVLVISASDIDIMRERYTMNQIESKLFATIIEKLKPDVAYVDSADVREEFFGEEILHELDFEPDIISKHGADDLYPVVSAASIIAKTNRDYEVRKIEEEIGVSIGSGYPSDEKTIHFLEKWIKEKGILPPHTRHSWKTAIRLLNASRTKKIEEFQGD